MGTLRSILIRTVAAVLSQNCRAEDIVCRYGGEEFTVLLPNTSVDRAAELAERLRVAVEACELVHHGARIPVT